MRFLVDQDVSAVPIEFLRGLGHGVAAVIGRYRRSRAGSPCVRDRL